VGIGVDYMTRRRDRIQESEVRSQNIAAEDKARGGIYSRRSMPSRCGKVEDDL
jgi:hypothetical protein